MQLLCTDVTYLIKNVQDEIEYDIDKAYGVCVLLTFLDFTGDLMIPLQIKQIMNLTVF